MKKPKQTSSIQEERSTKPPAVKRRRRRKPLSDIPAAAAAKGCCTIESPGAPDRDIPGLSQAECDSIQDAHRGNVTHWNPGACA
jgi:hypothetical protein